jgi:translation initiation factor IF-2
MSTGAKMRVYEIAKELNVPNKELIAKIRALGLEVNNHMSSLELEDVNRVKRSLERERLEKTETKRLSSTVLRRRSNQGEGGPVRRRAATDAAATIAAGHGASPPDQQAAQDIAERPAARPAVLKRPARREVEAEVETLAREAAPVREAAPAEQPRRAEMTPAPAPVEVARAPATPAPAAREAAAVEQPSTPVSAFPEPALPARDETPAAEKVEQAPAVQTGPTAKVAAEPVAPIEARPTQQEEAPVAAAQAPAQPAGKPRTPVVIAGPPVVRLPGQGPAEPAEVELSGRQEAPGQEPVAKPPAAEEQARPAQAQTQAQAQTPAQQAERKRRQQVESAIRRSKKPPQNKQDIADAARSRFEEELERARKRVSARESEERKKREVEDAKVSTQPQRDPKRPAVGTVISLPIPRIKITERAPTPARQIAGQGEIRGRFAQQRTRTPGGRKTRDFGRKRQPLRKGGGKSTQITTPAEHKRVIRMEDTIVIPELARAMGVKATEVLKKLWGMGMVGVNINASIDCETAQILSGEFGYEVQNVAFKEAEAFVSEPDEEEDLELRAPVVTVMGHVDHGKTSLLDYIRKSRVAAGEAGGITQHVAAYKVSAGAGHGHVVFLDTPGHEAFTEMRARGAQATDIVVLVVAANDGVMPQTIEAVNHAKDAKVSIIVAVNKIDLPDAQPERVRQQLADHGLIPEEWGGDTLYINVSALKGEGMPELLEAIALTAELLELKANPRKPARGVIIEAKLDRNRGPMATVIIQEGQLNTGDTVVAGCFFGKVRAMLDDLGNQIKVAGPSTPIELLGLDGVPDAGEMLNVADDEKVAKQVVEHRRQQRRKKELASTGKISLENLMERIQEGETHELKIVLKADVQGSSEALKASLIKQSTDKVKVNVISAGVGGITESDVNLAKAGGAIILGFHVRPAGKSAKHAEKEDVEIKLYDVIYEALEDVRRAMAGLLAPIKREHEIGKLEVRDTFTIPKAGTVAGCMVIEGRVLRRSLLRVIRDAVQIYEGKVGSLRRFKEDVSEVKEGYECGLMVQGFNDLKVGDVVEAYEIIEEAAQL